MTQKTNKRARTEADKLKQSGFNASRLNLTLIEPEALTLITDKAHPLYDPRVEWPVDPEDPFYKDILAHGVRDPVKVRKNGEKDGRPILQVVDGRQRVQTLVHINRHHPLPEPRRIKVEFVHGDDGAMVVLALSTNHQRKDETPFSRAVKIQKAMAFGRSVEEVAQACRWRTTKPVEDHLAILNFVPEVQQAFNGELPIGAIKTFAKVPREDQLAALEKVRSGGAKTKREVKAAVEAAQKGEEYVAPVGTSVITTARIEKLRKAFDQHLDRLAEVESSRDPDSLITRGARAVLEFLLGNEDAFDDFEVLREAINRADRVEAIAETTEAA